MFLFSLCYHLQVALDRLYYMLALSLYPSCWPLLQTLHWARLTLFCFDGAAIMFAIAAGHRYVQIYAGWLRALKLLH